MELNREEQYKKRIKELIYTMPKEFEEYVNYLVNETGRAYDNDLYYELMKISGFYSKLSLLYNKIAYKITPEDMRNANAKDIKDYLTYQTITDSREVLRNYQKFLIDKGLLDQYTIELPTPTKTSTSKVKQRNPRKITSPDEVSFFKDDTRKHSKTTIDLKYSLDKEIKSRYSDYTYKIYDHEKGAYILDQNGNILEIKRYQDAREYIKKLYK